METARLIFGTATASAAVRGGPARPESADRYAALRKLLSTPPRAGTDLAIVSHGNPFDAVVGTPYLAEGEAAVIRPANDGFVVIARIPKDGWTRLPRRERRSPDTSSRRRPGSKTITQSRAHWAAACAGATTVSIT